MTAPRRLQLRRGNATAVSTYTGAAGEVVINTTDWTLRVHDGSTVGGYVVTSNTSSLNANITQANLGLKGYVDLANTIQSQQISSANLGMKGYVDSVASQSIYGNANVASYLHTYNYSPYSNVNVAVYTNLSTYAWNANVTAANLGLKGYVDLANTIQSNQISAANLGMKGYVDSVTSQSIYGNSNVKSYLTSGFDGNILPSANVTYSLGNATNRWKDLYLSGNTIYLGDATITTEGGKLVTTGAAISPPTGAVAFANVQFEAETNFAQIRSYYVDNNFGYTGNLKSWATAPIVWDELRSAKITVNSYTVQGYTADFESLDTSGGRFANAVATLDATGNIASLTITDGGVGYDAYYPYYAADSTGYDSNYIGQSYTGSPTGKSFRRIGLIPTTASDVGNITSMGTLTRGASAPTVGSHTYTWTGNTGSTLSLTINWSSNTVSSYTYTRALPVLSSAQDWQNWLLDYQNTNDYGWYLGSSSGSGKAIYDYLFREALPDSLQYDIANTKWYPNGLNVNNSAQSDTISANSFTISFNRTSINYATLENSYGNPVYWSRGLSADTGISSGGDMTVAGDLRVSGDLYVSPTSIYMGDLRISAADGNLKVNTGIKFSDDSVQSTAYSNVQVAAYLTANPPGGSYSNVQVATYLSSFNGNIGNLWIDSTTYSPDLWLRTRQNNNVYISSDDINSLFLPPAVSGSQTALTGYGLGGAGVFSANSYVQLDGNGWDSGIELRTSFNSNNYTWTFSNIGNLTFPTGASITNGYPGGTVGDGQGWFVTPSGNAGGVASADGQQYVQVNNGYGIEIGTGWPGNAHAWHFGLNGNLTLPAGGYLGNVWGEPSETTLAAAPGGFVAIANSSGDQYVDVNDNNVQIGTNYRSGVGNVWLFYQNGWLVFPDNTVQTTAYTGYGNTQVGVYTNLSTYAYAANVTAANVGIKGYIDLANTIQSAQVGAANLAITAANVGMKGYVDSQTFYSNARVATYLQYGATSNISVAGNVTATYFVGNGALLTGIAASSSYSNVQVAAYLSTATINTTGNITAGNLITSGALYVANITTTGASGNISGANYITANYFVGNGSQLTGLPAGYSNVQTAAYLNATGYNLYSNVNVASYLSTATINTTGNITAQYLTGNINITGNVTGTSANVTLQAGSYSSVFDNQGNVTVPRLFANGNVQSTGYIFGNGAFLTGVVTGSSYSNVQVATYLPTYTGNIANIRLGVSGVLIFADGTTLSTASAIAGSNYGNGNVASYLITNGYVNTNSAYANGNVASYLITNQYINANSAYGNGNVTSYLPTHSGNVGVNNLIGTTPNVTLQANSYSSTFDIYGNVAFGNAAYPVQIYATGAITTNSNLTVGGMGVVMPNRPAFRVNGTAAPITTANVNLKGSAITTVFNQGNYLDTTTGKFTAPIAGIYEVLLNARVGTYNGLSQIAVLKNGNNSQGNVVCFWEIGSTTGTANHFGVSGTINLVAGDYLSANILAGNISFDGNDNWCVTYLG